MCRTVTGCEGIAWGNWRIQYGVKSLFTGYAWNYTPDSACIIRAQEDEKLKASPDR